MASIKPEFRARNPLAVMFRRNKKQEEEGENACPYCSHENEANAVHCKLCYYELSKSSREQGEAVDQETAGGIFAELTSDEDDSWNEGQSVEVQLNMDDISVEVDQYEIVEIGEGDVESIEYMDAESAPESSQTFEHQEAEIEKEILLDGETKDYQRFDLGDHDFMGDVAEPVHMGRGKLVGGGEVEDSSTEEVIGIESASQFETDVESETIDLPPLPDENEIDKEEIMPKGPPRKDTLLAEDDLVEAIIPAGPPAQPEEITSSENNHIWPWPAAEEWDSRDIHREVVSALELAKSNKIDEASNTLDRLGPHLGEDLELLYHIGMVLKQIGREEQMRTMLADAQRIKPDNKHVATAVTHLLE
jgi:hypothetical protein